MAHWIIRNGIFLSLTLLLMAGTNLAAAGSDPNNADVLSEHQISVAIDPNQRIELAAVSDIPEFKYSLLPSPAQRIDGNSYETLRPFFDKDPNHPERQPDRAWIRRQLEVPPKEMDIERVRAHLDACQGKLDILAKAALCKTVDWPKIWPCYEIDTEADIPVFFQGTLMSMPKRNTGTDDKAFKPKETLKIDEYPDLVEQLETAGQLIALKARYHIVRDDYPEACRWIRIGLSFSRQMAVNSNPLLGFAGMANATRILQQIEVWIQQPGSPSLFRSLQDLPDPLISGDCWDQTMRDSGYSEGRTITEIKPATVSNSQPLVLERQLRRFIAILGCMESIRLHAALNQQRFPGTLSEIQEVRVPADPLTGKPFDYAIDGPWIILRTKDGAPPGRFEFRYQVIETPAPPPMMNYGGPR